MANEISQNNIKQSYDLSGSKIFPKTTINGIVFDADDSLLGSSAIVKSLENEDLKVRNINVDIDSSTGGYIQLKTNNGDDNVAKLDIILGHKRLEDTETGIININSSDEANCDLNAYFRNVNVNANDSNLRFDDYSLSITGGHVEIQKGDISIMDGAVYVPQLNIIKDGMKSDQHSIYLSNNDMLWVSSESGVAIEGFVGCTIGKKSSYGQLSCDGSTISLDSSRNIKGNIDVSISTRGKLSANYMSGINMRTSKSVRLEATNLYINNSDVSTYSEMDLITNYNSVADGAIDGVKVSVDSSARLLFNVGIVKDTSQLNAVNIIRYTIDSSNNGELMLQAYDYDMDGSLSGDGSISIAPGDIAISASEIYLNCGHDVLGTVNGVNYVVMGVPIGSVVKWFNTENIPDGWDMLKNLYSAVYKGVLVVKTSLSTKTYFFHKIGGLDIARYASAAEGAYAFELDASADASIDIDKILKNDVLIKTGYLDGLDGYSTELYRQYDFYNVIGFEGEEGYGINKVVNISDGSVAGYSAKIYGYDSCTNVNCIFGQGNTEKESFTFENAYDKSGDKKHYYLRMISKDGSGNFYANETIKEQYDESMNKTVFFMHPLDFAQKCTNITFDDSEIMKYK